MPTAANRDVVVVGGSAGALNVLRELLSQLPDRFPAAIVVAFHVSPNAPNLLPGLLDRAGRLPAMPARDGATLRRGTVTVAPPDHHVILTAEGIRLSHGPRENRHRPSIDVLFRSAAVAYGPRVIGVILSGSLDDGVAGLWAIRRRGGVALVQDPREAEYPDLPNNALQVAGADARVPLAEMAARLQELITKPIHISAKPAPEAMASEVRMASEQRDFAEELDRLGPKSAFTCPECGGTLWEMEDHGTIGFRCHVGHAYSIQTLAAEQAQRIETALWAAVRSLEEGSRISERLAHAAAARGEPDRVQFHQESAAAGSTHASVLRNMLQEAVPAPHDDNESPALP